ncbi:metal ABC transporter ATP-binding protein [Desulfobaculum bizertense]|uniref:Zinc transport system ATP-binding protein n=2 Tax=Desulfobaculum TaxID=1433996 RepID=A0A1T4VJB7_9BACT|nr:ABC transporter ATP-binding protein [Desulfobaculum bizertense]SKA65064.1 zinc transport system ATP-binding protein [Desulfobaculum bizertense DSM 18034]
MDNPVVEMRGVSFSYDGLTRILRDVNLTVAAGDYLAVLGPNGGGKSTLMRLLLGLLTPSSGEIRILGKKPSEVCTRIGYMPQLNEATRIFPISVLGVTLMGLIGATGRGWLFSRKEKKLAQAALDRVGMLEFQHRRIDRLSGGQRQRVYIARAIISSPDLLLLDEPTASVDAGGRSALLTLLMELNREMSIIHVSHDLSVVAAGAHSVACVNRTLHFHPRPEITKDMLQMMYGGDEKGRCPVEIFAHGDIPHRVVEECDDEEAPALITPEGRRL